MKKIYEDMKSFLKKVFESKISTRILIGVGIVIVAMLIFSAGIFVGFHKASFGRDWGDNYERNFGMRSNNMMFGRDNFPNAHGAIGKIIKIELPTIIVQDEKDNTEKVVLIGDDTKIQKMMYSVKAGDLLVNDYAVIIGSPNNQGQIEAKLIRVMPFGLPIPQPQAPIPTSPAK